MARLGLKADADLVAFTVFKRAYDARRKTDIQLIYTLDCELANAAQEAALLAQGDPHLRPSPDTTYRNVAQAPADFFASGRSCGRWWWALGLAGCLRRWCWRRWA